MHKRTPAKISATINAHFTQLWWSIFLLSLLPGMVLLFKLATNQLGTNPLETLTRSSGRWAVIFLIITLTVTPARRLLVRFCAWRKLPWGKRLPDWNFLIRLRRMLGLWCYAYACFHVWVFLEYDLGYDWALLGEELGEKPYILAGVVAFLLLTPIAATSTDGMMRHLRRHWRRIHRLTYVVAILACLHWWWMSKPGDYRAMPYIVLLLGLLFYRLAVWRGWCPLPRSDDDGMEAPVRGRTSAQRLPPPPMSK